jgi:hypothetical protein
MQATTIASIRLPTARCIAGSTSQVSCARLGELSLVWLNDCACGTGDLLSVSPTLLKLTPNAFVLNERIALNGTWKHGYLPCLDLCNRGN